jgi:hypothetical protein
MRKVDYVGTEPFVSKLLFAKSVPGASSEYEYNYEGDGTGTGATEGTLRESGFEMSETGQSGVPRAEETCVGEKKAREVGAVGVQGV